MPVKDQELISWTNAHVPIYVGLEWEHAQIHQGNGFTISDKHSGLASAASLDHLLVTDGGQPHLRAAIVQATGGPCDVYLYEGVTTSDDGSLVTSFNNRRVDSNTASMLNYDSPTITDLGAQLEYGLLDVSGNQSGGAVEKIGGEWILKPNTKYVIRITNNDNSSVDVGFSLFWYELD